MQLETCLVQYMCVMYRPVQLASCCME